MSEWNTNHILNNKSMQYRFKRYLKSYEFKQKEIVRVNTLNKAVSEYPEYWLIEAENIYKQQKSAHTKRKSTF